jgi:hypothetical protein
MRQIVVHDEDEAAMCFTSGGLSDGMVVEANGVSSPQMLLRDDARDAAFGHPGSMGGPDEKLA